MKHIVHPVDFELKLFASEVQLGGGKPICMNWDERGRLWVAATIDYPYNLQREGQGHDRILILAQFTGRSRDSGEPIRQTFAAVNSDLRPDGKVGEVRFFFSREDALKAVGIEA